MRDDEIDPLTGLWNRQGVLRRLGDVEHDAGDGRSGRTDRWRSIVMVDVDDMKRINDDHGHEAGDGFLRRVAEHLLGCAGDQALVARIGGDEFLILSPLEPEECASLFDVSDGPHGGGADDVPSATLSAGAARLRPDSVDESRRQADHALWQAKLEGKGRLRVFGESTEEYLTNRRELVDRVRRMHDEMLRLLEQTRTDELTQLGNKRALDRHVEILDRRRQQPMPGSGQMAVLFIDLDRFGELNSNHGHFAGDHALELVGAELRAICRRSDLVVPAVGRAPFRKGGEEFVVVAPVTSYDDAAALGERVRAGIALLAIPHGAPGEPVLTATIGIGLTDDATTVLQALHEAAVIMTRLKNAGRRNCVELVDPADRPQDHELPHETQPADGGDPDDEDPDDEVAG